jgi:hypothetical protein
MCRSTRPGTSLFPLILIAAGLALIKHTSLVPCKNTIQLNFTIWNASKAPLNVFCTIDDRRQNYLDGCLYGCVGGNFNIIRDRLVPTSNTPKPIRKIEMFEAFKSRANSSSSNQMTLDEIGIKKVFGINLDSRTDRLVNSVMQLFGYLRFLLTRLRAINISSIYNEIITLYRSSRPFPPQLLLSTLQS